MTEETIVTEQAAVVTKAIVKIEGQEIPIPLDIAHDDALVKRALAPFFPGAANSKINRTEKDDTLYVDVVKVAGSKGASPLSKLMKRKGGKNPVVEVYEDLRDRKFESPEEMTAMNARIERALKDGEEQYKIFASSLEYLSSTEPDPGPVVPLGF